LPETGPERDPRNSPALQFARWIARRLFEGARPVDARRVLFLDDDPTRAAVFLRENPEAVWVETVEACLTRLTERWDEVHLDHDLGGKTHVDTNQDDCGMEVIRWLCKEPRTHLRDTLFLVHTHNSAAGLLMVLQLRASAYKAELRPFGLNLARMRDHDEPESMVDAKSPAAPGRPPRRLQDWLRSLRARPKRSAELRNEAE
jgi:hypothetical protein